MKSAIWMVLWGAMLPAQVPVTVLTGVAVNTVTGGPVRRAAVRVTASGGDSYATAPTDREGKFSFSLPLGAYRVEVSAAGFRPEEEPLTVTIGVEPLAPLRIRLTPDGVVAGRITDGLGAVLSDASVEALREGDLRPAGRASVDDRGEYRLIHIAPGRYYFRASGGQRDGLGYRAQFHPGAARMRDATPVEVKAGDEARVDFRLASVPLHKVRISIEGAPAEDHGEWVMLSVVAADLAPVMAQAIGAARVGPRNYETTVAAGEYLFAGRGTFAGRELRGLKRARVEGDSEVTITLQAPVSIAGSIRMENNTVVGGTRISLEAVDQLPFSKIEAEADSQGRFVFREVPPGIWKVSVAVAGKPAMIREGTPIVVAPEWSGKLNLLVRFGR